MIFDRFFKDESGNFALMAALCSGVLLLGTSAAIEISALVKEQDNLQDIADAAVLAAAVSGETKLSDMQAIAEDMAGKHLDGKYTLALSQSDEDLLVELSTDYEMIMMGAFGYKTREISVEAGSRSGTGGKLSLALALDTTLSMEGSRMAAMTSAASDLVQSVKEADKGRGNAKVAVVPFSDYVRIDTGFAGEDWIDVQPDHESTWRTLDEDASTNCVQEGSGESRRTVCDEYVYTTQTANITWRGCMVSRLDGLHKTAAFDGNPFKGNTGHTTCNGNNSQVTPLTDDFDQLKDDIAALQARGKTYIPVGLQWGWRILEEEALFTDEEIDPSEPVQKVLLLMTDGSNTVSLNGTSADHDESVTEGWGDWDGVYHYGSPDEEYNREVADELTVEMCAMVKEAGIRLITVAYEVEDDDTKSMLRSCASTGGDFYDARDAGKLKQAFGKIGSGFTKARLTK